MSLVTLVVRLIILDALRVVRRGVACFFIFQFVVFVVRGGYLFKTWEGWNSMRTECREGKGEGGVRAEDTPQGAIRDPPLNPEGRGIACDTI